MAEAHISKSANPACGFVSYALTPTGVGSYLSDAEMQLKAHFRQLNLKDKHTWMPGLDNVGFAAGAPSQLPMCCPSCKLHYFSGAS